MLIQVIAGSTREGRISAAVAGWVADYLRRGHDIEVDVLDLRDLALPNFDGPPPAKAPREYPTEAVAEFGRRVERADAYIVATAEYNHGYPAVLKNAFDWAFVEWRRKPIAFVGWGNVGGARAIEQLRQVTVELEMAPLRHAVHIMGESILAVRTGDVSVLGAYEPRLKLLVDDLLWWATTLAAGRADEVEAR
jgi:NAD(P)H-dependent FMN reductase